MQREEDTEDGEDEEDYGYEEEEEENEADSMTEEQRMEDGRRMSQIFVARMFKHAQRVVQAYREKVAQEAMEGMLLK